MHSQFSIHNGIDISATRKREEEEENRKKNQQHNNETKKSSQNLLYSSFCFHFHNWLKAIRTRKWDWFELDSIESWEIFFSLFLSISSFCVLVLVLSSHSVIIAGDAGWYVYLILPSSVYITIIILILHSSYWNNMPNLVIRIHNSQHLSYAFCLGHTVHMELRVLKFRFNNFPSDCLDDA